MASRFWVGGTGTWDSTTTTNWAATTGGTGGQSVPGSADTVTFDASSGGGTVTLNFGGTITIQSITLGAFTGTFDNSVNNNNMTLLAAGTAFNNSGTGTRTIKLGSATYSLSGNTAVWNFQSAANCTYTGGLSTVTFPNGGTGHRSFNTGGFTQHGNVIFGSSSGPGAGYSIGGGGTLASLTITAPNFVQFTTAATTTITAAINWAGSSSSHIGINSDTYTLAAQVAVAAGSTCAYCGFHDMNFTGSPTASNSFNLGNVSGITITGPSGGVPGIIGG
jgi:hypothetical protein